MEIYEGLNTGESVYPSDAYRILMICLCLSGSIPLIICLMRRIRRTPINKHILPVYSFDTTHIINNPNVKLRVNVETPRPKLNILE